MATGPRARRWGCWDREGPTANPAWQRELDRLFPPGQNLESLHVYWEPGYAWEPVERWVIGTVMPPAFVPPWYHQWLQGENPGLLGYYDPAKPDGAGGQGAWVSEAPPISRRQWHFYRESGGCLLTPYWIVQGSRGGHRYRWSRPESMISRLHGGPKDTPPPGDLSYATPDKRTFTFLARMDRVRRNLAVIEGVEQGAIELSETEAELATVAKQEVADWLADQAAEWAEGFRSMMAKPVWDSAPTMDKAANIRFGEELEKMEEDYITGA